MLSIEEMRSEGILKEERVSYLKSKITLYQGKLYLTRNRLFLQAHKKTIQWGGHLFSFLQKNIKKKNRGFDLEFKNITRVERGKYTRLDTITVTDNRQNSYRLIVIDVDGWEKEINQRRF